MEITIISAQGLKKPTSNPFSQRLRPFITITTYPPYPCNNKPELTNNCCFYTTRIDDLGGVNPTWGDKFHINIDPAFFANPYSCIYLQLYTKRLMMGPVNLGWCQIPVSDIRWPPVGSVRNLSYRIRARDGTRTLGVVKVALKLTGNFETVSRDRLVDSRSGNMGTVIGIPATEFSGMNICKENSYRREH